MSLSLMARRRTPSGPAYKRRCLFIVKQTLRLSTTHLSAMLHVESVSWSLYGADCFAEFVMESLDDVSARFLGAAWYSSKFGWRRRYKRWNVRRLKPTYSLKSDAGAHCGIYS